jgi:hypothetical protein
MQSEPRIDGLTLFEYCQDADRVRADAKAAGVKGKPITRHHMTKGCYNGKTSVQYAELDNLELYEFAKAKYGRN